MIINAYVLLALALLCALGGAGLMLLAHVLFGWPKSARPNATETPPATAAPTVAWRPNVLYIVTVVCITMIVLAVIDSYTDAIILTDNTVSTIIGIVAGVASTLATAEVAGWFPGANGNGHQPNGE